MEKIFIIFKKMFTVAAAKIPGTVSLLNGLLSLLEKGIKFIKQDKRTACITIVIGGIIVVFICFWHAENHFEKADDIPEAEHNESGEVASDEVSDWDDNSAIEATSISGEEEFSRTLYSYQQANEGAIDHITFNSIKVSETDAAWAEKNDLELPLLGNETNFVGAREDLIVDSGASNAWEGSNIAAEDGKTYIVRLYVHNNSSGDMNAVAEDTQVRFYVPFGSAATQTVSGWLQSSNAAPNQYSDTVNFNSTNDTPFHLEYVSGSALLENGGFASGDGVVLPDSITNQGNPTNNVENEWTLIGYDALDGLVPGCYKYINYVSIRVKVIYD